jgi:hypothetical protein
LIEARKTHNVKLLAFPQHLERGLKWLVTRRYERLYAQQSRRELGDIFPFAPEEIENTSFNMPVHITDERKHCKQYMIYRPPLWSSSHSS